MQKNYSEFSVFSPASVFQIFCPFRSKSPFLSTVHWVLFFCLIVGVSFFTGRFPLFGAETEKNEVQKITFLSTSDSHYRGDENHRVELADTMTINAMNKVSELSFPQESGGGKIGKPQGVLVLGDLIDDGDMKKNGVNLSEKQYAHFVNDFGLDGTDGRLKYPVFEGWGNHDGPPEGFEKNGFSPQKQLKKRNEIRLEKGLIQHLSENRLHYSWDWADIHFVQLGIYPADVQHSSVKYSPEWHHPQNALAFLKKDLEQNVGNSERPIVLMSHCGFDTDWWSREDWKFLYEVVRPYNVIL